MGRNLCDAESRGNFNDLLPLLNEQKWRLKSGTMSHWKISALQKKWWQVFENKIHTGENIYYNKPDRVDFLYIHLYNI